MKEPTFEQLVAYASGELTDRDASVVEAFLALLPEAARSAVRLHEVITTLRDDDTTEPSTAAVRRAMEAFRLDEAAEPWAARAGRIIADLVFDTRNKTVLAGFRGPGISAQLAYSCPDGRIDLQLLPRSGQVWRVRGQVRLTDDADEVMLLDTDEQVVASVTPDAHGRFLMEARPGLYDLMIDLGDRSIVAPGLEIGPELN